MSGSLKGEKKHMTVEERLVLCQKLDQELDDFIDSLEKRRYAEGWPEDRWEEEMNKHPFFMKTTPVDGEMSPLAEGLARLKYDPEENTPAELATNYKEDGNFNFKHKNYRLAILSYTEGIKQKCSDAALLASLHNNRAAAHWHLRNYASALRDSERALALSARHAKARLRAARAAFEIRKYDACIEHCKELLAKEPSDATARDLLNTAKKNKSIQERDQRRRDRLDQKDKEQKDSVIQAIIDRGVRICKCDDEDDLDLSKLEPSLPGAQDAVVRCEDGILKWPVLFMYPEYQVTDLVRACPENVPLATQMNELFPAPWDSRSEYRLSTVKVYYEGRDRMPHAADPAEHLGRLLLAEHCELRAGTPTFYVLVHGSDCERRFLDSYL